MTRGPLRFIITLLLLPVAAGAADDGGLLAGIDNRVPEWLIDIPPTPGGILVADTGAAALHRFEVVGDRVIAREAAYMSIGTNGVGKERAWDRRTPLGVYFVTERLDTSKLADKYGIAAFPLDYPNAWDRLHGRTGDGIWLHGVDHRNPLRPRRDTDGCLALPNDALAGLAERIRPLETPVLVTRGMRWASVAQVGRLRRELGDALETWRASLEAGDLHTYLSLYADNFRYGELDRDDWVSFRMQVFLDRPLDAVTIGNLFLIGDPEEPGLYLSRFSQGLVVGSKTVNTTRRLYWRRSADGIWQIVAEGAG